MSAPLAREQVELIAARMHVVILREDARLLLAHDDALRQQVAALELENADLLTNLSLCKGNELAQQIVTLTAERDEHRRWREKLADDLHEREQQLAAMTQERDLLHRDNHALRAEVEDWRQKFQKALTP